MSSNFFQIDEYEQQSLYSFQNEHDACGVGLILNLYGEKSHEIVDIGLQVLENTITDLDKAINNGKRRL